MLLWVLEVLLPEEQQAIIFTCTRHHVEFVHNLLLKVRRDIASLLRHKFSLTLHGLLSLDTDQSGVSSAPIYGLLDQAARKINLAKFRARKCRCLVVTDVAARGIDIPYLDNVINFDFPDKPKLFVHRCVPIAAHLRPHTHTRSHLNGGCHVCACAVWVVSLGKDDRAPRSRLWRPRRCRT